MTKNDSTIQLIDQIKSDARTELVDQMIEMLQSLRGGGKSRPVGSKSAKPAGAKKAGYPQGDTHDEGGKGRKPCPNCGKYVAARAGDCPNCFFNFAEKKVVDYTDADGNPVAPPFAKGKAAPKATAVKEGEEGSGDELVKKCLLKHLKKGSKNGGISAKDLLSAVTTELDATPSTVSPVMKEVLKTHASKTSSGNFTIKAA